MAALTKAQRNELERAYLHLQRARAFLFRADVAIAKRGTHATTTLHYTRADGATLYELTKEMGSDLTGLQAGMGVIRLFLDGPRGEEP